MESLSQKKLLTTLPVLGVAFCYYSDYNLFGFCIVALYAILVHLREELELFWLAYLGAFLLVLFW